MFFSNKVNCNCSFRWFIFLVTLTCDYAHLECAFRSESPAFPACLAEPRLSELASDSACVCVYVCGSGESTVYACRQTAGRAAGQVAGCVTKRSLCNSSQVRVNAHAHRRSYPPATRSTARQAATALFRRRKLGNVCTTKTRSVCLPVTLNQCWWLVYRHFALLIGLKSNNYVCSEYFEENKSRKIF